MELVTQILEFIENPFPLWETTLTHQLVADKWSELEKRGIKSFQDYNTARFWFGESALETGTKKEIAESTASVEMPSFQLKSFYDEHGLELLTENEIEASDALLKLENAISILRLVGPAYNCISDLVWSIQLLRQLDVEIDVSYSHPEIPFSIFVSVCEDDSIISRIRVAESILHEAMHLKLTLIESFVSLIKPDTISLYYSPWRDEERPIRGVLHGLFVFRSIKEFYQALHRSKRLPEAEDYFQKRVLQTEYEIEQIKEFKTSSSLTAEGANLVTSLLPSN